MSLGGIASGGGLVMILGAFLAVTTLTCLALGVVLFRRRSRRRDPRPISTRRSGDAGHKRHVALETGETGGSRQQIVGTLRPGDEDGQAVEDSAAVTATQADAAEDTRSPCSSIPPPPSRTAHLRGNSLAWLEAAEMAVAEIETFESDHSFHSEHSFHASEIEGGSTEADEESPDLERVGALRI